MSLRKLLYLVKPVCCNAFTLQSTNAAPSRNWLFAANSARWYSAENLGDKKDIKGDKVDILGRFFPQSPVKENADHIKQEQEKFEKENKEKAEENEKSWKRMKIGFAVFGGALTVMGGCLVVELGSPRRDPDGQPIEDEFSELPIVIQYLKRAWKDITFYEKGIVLKGFLIMLEECTQVQEERNLNDRQEIKMIKEPSREKLLPDPLPAQYQPAYTLVLEFTDVLVHPDWSYHTGWRFKKRPGVDQFLQTVANSNYEVIIFTTENAFLIWPVIDKLDPENKFITYRLFRDSTHFVDGVHVKNLDGLNRDLSKVIVVDWNKASTKFHPQNSLVLQKWKGADDDTALLDLANLLQTISMSEVSDVREVLTYYSQFPDPIAAFRDNQRRLLEHMEAKQQQPDTPLASNWIRSFTRR